MVWWGCSWSAFSGMSWGKACPPDFNSLSSRRLLYLKARLCICAPITALSCHRDHLSLAMNFTGDESTSTPFHPSVRALTRVNPKPVSCSESQGPVSGKRGVNDAPEHALVVLHLLGQGTSEYVGVTNKQGQGWFSAARKPNLKAWKECEGPHTTSQIPEGCAQKGAHFQTRCIS